MTLIEAITATIRRLHYSSRTEEAYVHWIRAFVAFHGGRHPRVLGADEVTAFVNHLAVDRHTSASTQNQALCAIVFLYRRVLAVDLPQLTGLERSPRPHHLPAVLSRRETIALLEHVEPAHRLIAEILYGSERRGCASLHIKEEPTRRLMPGAHAANRPPAPPHRRGSSSLPGSPIDLHDSAHLPVIFAPERRPQEGRGPPQERRRRPEARRHRAQQGRRRPGTERRRARAPPPRRQAPCTSPRPARPARVSSPSARKLYAAAGSTSLAHGARVA